MINFLASDLYAVFGLLDTAQLEADVGFDDLFTEPHLEPASLGDKTGVVGRRETEVTVRVQFEQKTASRLNQLATGRQVERYTELTADWRELVEADLIDANGYPKIRDGARLIKVTNRDGAAVHLFPIPEGGLYVDDTEIDPHLGGVPRQATWRLSPKLKGER